MIELIRQRKRTDKLLVAVSRCVGVHVKYTNRSRVIIAWTAFLCQYAIYTRIDIKTIIKNIRKANRMKKTILDDGFQQYLTEGATFVGSAGIPMLMNLDNVQLPKDMIPFAKVRSSTNKRQYVHFYQHDKEFSVVLTATKRYLDLLKMYDGVITPDCTMMINQSPCLLQTNTYMNRAVGFYLQKNGIPVIPNIRWSDESSFEYCFLGVHKGSMVSVSTHGCIKSKEQKHMFRIGLEAMLDQIQSKVVLVHGKMPDEIFLPFKNQVEFHRYASEFERTHEKVGE